MQLHMCYSVIGRRFQSLECAVHAVYVADVGAPAKRLIGERERERETEEKSI